MNPLFYSLTLTSAAESSSTVTEVFAILAPAALALFAFYKLGTVESIIKTIATVVIFIGGMYAAGYVFPSIQGTGWYQLIAWIVEVGPRVVLDQIGGKTS